MDQGGKGVRVQLFPLPGSPVCPVGVVREFFAVCPVSAGPFLVHRDGSPLSKFQFVSIFRKCLKAAGMDYTQYASHSFRIGAATEATRYVLDDAAVKRIGGWDSRRFHTYIRPHLVAE